VKIDTSKAKPPLKLYVREGEGTELKEVLVAHACGECRIVQIDEKHALECHGIRTCDCGAVIEEHYYTACRPCRERIDRERDTARLAKAKRVLEGEASMLFCDCCEKFFDASAELVDDHFNSEREIPDFAWACHEEGLSIDMAQVLANELERANFYEDAAFTVDAELELQGLVNAWLLKHPMVSHFPGDEVVDLSEAKAVFAAQEVVDAAG
jgi:hypothetical protein